MCYNDLLVRASVRENFWSRTRGGVVKGLERWWVGVSLGRPTDVIRSS